MICSVQYDDDIPIKALIADWLSLMQPMILLHRA